MAQETPKNLENHDLSCPFVSVRRLPLFFLFLPGSEVRLHVHICTSWIITRHLGGGFPRGRVGSDHIDEPKW